VKKAEEIMAAQHVRSEKFPLPTIDAPKADAPKVDAPKVEPPKIEM